MESKTNLNGPLFIFKEKTNFWLCRVFVVAHGLSSCGSRALVHLTLGGKWKLMTKWEERGACIVVVVQMPGCAWVFATPWTAARLVSPVLRYLPSLLELMSIESVCEKYESESCSVVSDSLATPWTVAHQAPLSMEFYSPECWNR